MPVFSLLSAFKRVLFDLPDRKGDIFDLETNVWLSPTDSVQLVGIKCEHTIKVP